MEEEMTTKPEPLRASVTLRGRPISVTATIGKPTLIVRQPTKPPWHRRFIDRNLRAATLLLKEATREAIVESIKWLLFGRKRQPAQA